MNAGRTVSDERAIPHRVPAAGEPTGAMRAAAHHRVVLAQVFASSWHHFREIPPIPGGRMGA
jgi:hypothetical protein